MTLQSTNKDLLPSCKPATFSAYFDAFQSINNNNKWVLKNSTSGYFIKCVDDHKEILIPASSSSSASPGCKLYTTFVTLSTEKGID
ncbi:unnamed protein product [Euphydryas editha]|uniref:Uncharacterized protein n=1 Tax=Euphydryas editha TaxID=104508 RepID=A0AAU9TIH3_EUPED|nr:unnamed protein product [Euphydryas editha]